MDMGTKIAHAIEKEVSHYNFIDWLEDWNIDEEDWDKFIQAGIDSFNVHKCEPFTKECFKYKHNNIIEIVDNII